MVFLTKHIHCTITEKLGMTFEGFKREAMLVKGSYRTIGVSAILRNEYEFRKQI